MIRIPMICSALICQWTMMKSDDVQSGEKFPLICRNTVQEVTVWNLILLIQLKSVLHHLTR